MVQIVPYSSDLKEHFKTLNLEWIHHYFEEEEEDTVVLNDPQKYILDKGGKIWFAQIEGQTVGTIALKKESQGVYELAKMGVKKGHRGAGIGRLLIKELFREVRALQAKKLYIISNTKLETALHLYLNMGFVEVEVDPKYYERYNRCDIKLEHPDFG